jgi:ketosteroid isomerase-like protein
MPQNDVAKIKALVRRYVTACNAGDAGGLEDCLSGNAALMPPDVPKLSGKKAIARWAKETYFDVFENELMIKLDHVLVFGRHAFGTGRFAIALVPKAGGGKMKGAGKHMNTFEKQKDGSWKYTRSIWNFDKPLA